MQKAPDPPIFDPDDLQVGREDEIHRAGRIKAEARYMAASVFHASEMPPAGVSGVH
jgi:hypothetical protein